MAYPMIRFFVPGERHLDLSPVRPNVRNIPNQSVQSVRLHLHAKPRREARVKKP